MKSFSLPEEITSRRAIVYVRQSTGSQVVENLESQRLQYEMANHARATGFKDVVVIDSDLGISANGTMDRPGFRNLVGQVCEGNVGAVFCYDASRLARNGREWHHLLELCALVGEIEHRCALARMLLFDIPKLAPYMRPAVGLREFSASLLERIVRCVAISEHHARVGAKDLLSCFRTATAFE